MEKSRKSRRSNTFFRNSKLRESSAKAEQLASRKSSYSKTWRGN